MPKIISWDLKCPNCGFSVNTGKTQYPHTQIEFDLKGEEIE